MRPYPAGHGWRLPLQRPRLPPHRTPGSSPRRPYSPAKGPAGGVVRMPAPGETAHRREASGEYPSSPGRGGIYPRDAARRPEPPCGRLRSLRHRLGIIVIRTSQLRAPTHEQSPTLIFRATPHGRDDRTPPPAGVGADRDAAGTMSPRPRRSWPRSGRRGWEMRSDRVRSPVRSCVRAPPSRGRARALRARA